jgi:hypothetical protein
MLLPKGAATGTSSQPRRQYPSCPPQMWFELQLLHGIFIEWDGGKILTQVRVVTQPLCLFFEENYWAPMLHPQVLKLAVRTWSVNRMLTLQFHSRQTVSRFWKRYQKPCRESEQHISCHWKCKNNLGSGISSLGAISKSASPEGLGSLLIAWDYRGLPQDTRGLQNTSRREPWIQKESQFCLQLWVEPRHSAESGPLAQKAGLS